MKSFLAIDIGASSGRHVVGWREYGEVFGILGMIFSVPVCAVLYSLYLEFMKNRTRHDTPLK
jgi:hypothetical protein